MPAFCAERATLLLKELRFVAKEVGGLAEAKNLPTVVRRWWISEIFSERAQAEAERT